MTKGVAPAATDGLPGFAPVGIADVEAELASRRIAATDDDRPLTRACALNLIYFVDDIDEAAAVTAVVETVGKAHPIRAIGMMYDPAYEEQEVHAWLRVTCGAAVPGGRLASEEIALTAHPDGAERLASVVRGVMSCDLPVVLWWRGGSVFLNRLFKALAPTTDLVVADSIRFGDGPAALDTLRRICDMRGGAVAVADMNWKRTSSWRSALAACFDDAAVRAMLPDLDHCDIDFSLGPEGRPAQASARSLLLARWMITRLPSVAGHGDIRGRASAWATPGAILALTLRSSTSGAAVSVTWPSPDAVIVATVLDRAGAQTRSWRFRPDPEDEATLLDRCLDSIAHDPLFDAALRAD